ncbi:MAG: signal peptidase, partial [Planctomycetes bacterium]|nr:signal peptidase [Planctomycetota bacterium]
MPKYVVRHGAMRFLGVFSTRGNEKYSRSAHVIARTSRGLEAGEVLCEATDAAVQHLKDPPTGQILRAMTADDDNELAHLKAQEGHEFHVSQELVRRLGLGMQL